MGFDVATFFLRFVLGLVFIYHGYPKVFGSREMPRGWRDFSDLLRSAGLNFPNFWAPIAAFVEFFGGIAIMFGFLTPLFAILLVMNMFVATVIKITKWQKGFSGSGGYELDIALLVIAFALFFLGAGNWSLDYYVFLR